MCVCVKLIFPLWKISQEVIYVWSHSQYICTKSNDQILVLILLKMCCSLLLLSTTIHSGWVLESLTPTLIKQHCHWYLEGGFISDSHLLNLHYEFLTSKKVSWTLSAIAVLHTCKQLNISFVIRLYILSKFFVLWD